MEILVTLDTIKNYAGSEVLKFPPGSLVTKEARIFAASKGIRIYVGDELLREPFPVNSHPTKKAVISVIGEDRVGIIAGISEVLAKNNVNILDITQTSIEGLFTMIMVVDISGCTVSFEELKKLLEDRGKSLSVRVDAQREEVFRFMHRI